MAVCTARTPSFSRMAPCVPPKGAAPNPRIDTFQPVLPKTRYFMTKPNLRFQDGHGRGIMAGVAQREMNDPGLSLRQQACAGVVEYHERLAGFLPAHFHVLPSQLRANARAERFGDRFL